MSGKSRKKQKQTSSSRGKSKRQKRITDGRKHKTKKAKLQCRHCGGWFESLGQINQHYSAVGHKKRVKPPKKVKFSKDYSQRDLDMVEALMELMRDPIAWREKVREKIVEKARRSGVYGFG